MAVSTAGSSKNAATLALHIAPRLSRWVQTQMTADDEHDVSIRQLTALQYIGNADVTLGDVARHLNVTPAVVTGLIDRLERRGYVRRVGSQFDRRRVHIELTTSGEDVRDHAENRLAAELERRISSISGEDVDTLTSGLRLMDELLRSMDREREKKSASSASDL